MFHPLLEREKEKEEICKDVSGLGTRKGRGSEDGRPLTSTMDRALSMVSRESLPVMSAIKPTPHASRSDSGFCRCKAVVWMSFSNREEGM